MWSKEARHTAAVKLVHHGGHDGGGWGHDIRLWKWWDSWTMWRRGYEKIGSFSCQRTATRLAVDNFKNLSGGCLLGTMKDYLGFIEHALLLFCSQPGSYDTPYVIKHNQMGSPILPSGNSYQGVWRKYAVVYVQDVTLPSCMLHGQAVGRPGCRMPKLLSGKTFGAQAFTCSWTLDAQLPFLTTRPSCYHLSFP